MEKIDFYKDFLEKSFAKYFSNEEMYQFYGRNPLSRYHTFKYCIEAIRKNNYQTIVELGTSRSFVDGQYEGCNSNNTKYWEPNNPVKWDWSAGFFTYVFGEEIHHKPSILHTVDIESDHIKRCELMTRAFSENIKYYVSSSEDFLKNFQQKIDLLYLDTGDMTPIEVTAQLHLREAKIIVERNILNDNGLILIDDVRNPVPKKFGEKSDLGKAKYSIPYFLQNGYKIIMDELQVILQKQ
jgi:hypothetical protein